MPSLRVYRASDEFARDLLARVARWLLLALAGCSGDDGRCVPNPALKCTRGGLPSASAVPDSSFPLTWCAGARQLVWALFSGRDARKFVI